MMLLKVKVKVKRKVVKVKVVRRRIRRRRAERTKLYNNLTILIKKFGEHTWYKSLLVSYS